LLDALRGTNTAAKEAGGITQAVAAFGVNLASVSAVPAKGDAKAGPPFVTFLDTPGHALFASMRQRGAAVTDIVILVVDGKDGVMPQTVECVKAIISSNLNMIVAVTKCDVVDADTALEKVAKELLEHGVVTEKHGGDSPIVAVSAKV
jgi:translation initiation factor IF-2